MTDRQLLQQYLAKEPAAFEQLVRRHIDMVYAAAKRQVGTSSADDVTQAVFIMLTHKAQALRNRDSIAGWLYRAVGFCCANYRRIEKRRQKHERESAAMVSLTQNSSDRLTDLRDLFDAALAQLPQRDREAILLCHFQQLNYAQTALALNITEEAARKRAARGLQKLRLYLASKGHIHSDASLLQKLASASTAAPPSLLAATLLSAHTPLTATTPSAIIAKGALHMANTKLKISLAAAVLALLIAPAILLIAYYGTSHDNHPSLSTPAIAAQNPPAPTFFIAAATKPTDTTQLAATATTTPAAMDLLVVDKDSHDPIPGLAIITAGGAIPRFNGVTDAQGRIQVPLPTTDKYPYFNVAVHGAGYAFKTLRWFPGSTTMAGKPFTAYTLQMERTATVHGTLLDENNNPIPHASVMLGFETKFADPHELFDIGGSEGFVFVKTDNAGRFTYNAAPATCDEIQIGACDDTHLAQPAQPYKPLASLYDATAKVALTTGGILVEGTVVDDNDNPIPKALVMVSDNNYLGQKTDATGKFVFRLPPDTTFGLYVQAKSFAPDSQTIQLTKNPQTLTIHLHPK